MKMCANCSEWYRDEILNDNNGHNCLETSQSLHNDKKRLIKELELSLKKDDKDGIFNSIMNHEIAEIIYNK